jgi:hypothetical protein
MPNISASDYTTFLKYKAASTTPIRPAIQTRDNATVSQSVLNANILASQAAYLTTPPKSVPVTSSATVSAVSSQTVTAARTDIIASVSSTTTLLTYTCSQEHGLNTGDVVTIAGFSGAVTPNPNVTSLPITKTGDTTFTISATGAGFISSAVTGRGSITGRVYYTTNVVHGLTAGQQVTVSGISTFTATNATTLAVPTTSTFVLSSTTTGSSVTLQSGTIDGRIYYTTSTAHGLTTTTSTQFVTISGLSSFNVASGSIINVPSSTVFVLAGTDVGAITSQTGTVTVTTLYNQNVSFLGNARIVGQPTNNVNNPSAKSTLSSKFVQPGGLPANNVVGTYTRLPQNAGWIQGNMVSSGPKRF